MAKSAAAKLAANVRKQIQRRIDRYTKDRKKLKGAERRAVTASIKELRKAYKAAQVGRGKKARTKQGMNEFYERMAYAKNVVKQAPLIRNKKNIGNFLYTQQQLNLASRKGGDNMSKYTKAQVKVFYRVTEPIWTTRGKSLEETKNIMGKNRNELIMKSVGANSLEEAIDKVLNSEAAKTDLNNVLGLVIKSTDMTDEEYREAMRLYSDLMETDNGPDNGDNLESPTETRAYITV